MTLLTKEDLVRLDGMMDSVISSLPLLTEPIDDALVHLLSAFQSYCVWWENQLMSARSKGAIPTNTSNPQDGMQFAVPWLFKYCHPPVHRNPYAIKPRLMKDAQALQLAAINYARIWNVMTGLHKGWFEAEWIGETRIKVNITPTPGPDITLVDTFLNAADSPESLTEQRAEQLVFRQEALFKNYRGNSLLLESQRNSYSPSFVQAIQSLASLFSEGSDHLWEMDPSWDLGGYTVGEFRRFWYSLTALAQLDGGVQDSRSVLRWVSSRKHWVERMSACASLPPPTVGKVLDDITFAPQEAFDNGIRIDITIKPFLPLFDQLLVCSMPLVMLCNPERNLWSVVNIKRPTLHDTLKNRKQELQIRKLRTELTPLGLICVGPIPINSGNIDLLVLDPAHRFGVCCELKWFNGPDWVSQVTRFEQELNTGLGETRRSLVWIKTERAEEVLHRVIQNDDVLNNQTKESLSQVDFRQYHFEGMVVSANSMGSGYAYDPNIPILSQRMLHWLIVEPHRKSLETAWRVGKEQRWRFEEGKHYSVRDAEVKFGSITFVTVGQGIIPGEPWNPSTGFDFSGLE